MERFGLQFNGDFFDDRDFDRIGINRVAEAVGDLAIELNAVPRGVGGTGFGGVCASAPFAERSLSRLLVIPLVGKP